MANPISKLPTEITTLILDYVGDPNKVSLSKAIFNIYNTKIADITKQRLQKEFPDSPWLDKEFTVCSFGNELRKLAKNEPFPSAPLNHSRISDKLFQLYLDHECRIHLNTIYLPFFKNVYSQPFNLIGVFEERLKEVQSKPPIQAMTFIKGRYFGESVFRMNGSNLKLPFLPVFLFHSDILELVFSKNSLSTIEVKACELRSLMHLDLSQNSIKFIPREIKNLSSLQLLNLSKNKIKKIPQEIAALSSLESLYLENNNIMDVPPFLANLKAKIYLMGNPFTFIPSTVKNIQDVAINEFVYDLDRDFKLLQEASIEKLPKRLSMLIHRNSGSGNSNTQSESNIENSKKNLLEAMTTLQVKCNGFDTSTRKLNYLKLIINTSTDILHEQQIVEAALVCINKLKKDEKDGLIKRIWMKNNLSISQASEILSLYPLKNEVKKAFS